MVAHHPHTRSVRASSRVREAGFTIIELIVVLIVIALIIAGVWHLTRSGTSASRHLSAVATARIMGDAIEGFRKDHGGRPPRLGDARDWPAPLERGPRNPYSDRSYLRKGTPDMLANGSAAMSTSATSSARFTLQYTQSTSPNGWRIVVHDRDSQRPPCHITGGAMPSTGMPVC